MMTMYGEFEAGFLLAVIHSDMPQNHVESITESGLTDLVEKSYSYRHEWYIRTM